MDERPLILSPAMRTTCIVLQVVPLPGVGAILAGSKNPHSRYVGRGVAQLTLVVLGSWPLIVPGVAGLAWAVWDAVRIAQRSRAVPAWSEPSPDADPETLRPTREQRRAQKEARRAERRAGRAERQAEAAARKAERAARKAEQADEDDTRFMP